VTGPAADDLAELHDELRAVARDLLSKTDASPTPGSDGPGGPAWSLLADAGWLGLEAPESVGGAGATFAETAVVLEEMGRAITAGPYLGTVVLAGATLGCMPPSAERDELLGRVVRGETVVSVAMVDGDLGDDVLAAEPPFRIETVDGVTVLRGRAAFVPDAPTADHLLLVARSHDGPAVVVSVPATAPGLDIAAQPLLDATRPFGSVRADAVEVDDSSVSTFVGDPTACTRALLDRAALAVTIDSLGLSRAMLDATVEYAQARHQFGRPIGSFQAVKHACADMAVQLAVSTELVAVAVLEVVADGPDASTAVSMAKSHVCSAAVDIVGQAMQLHGGIGYTWESGIHAYLKRAALDRALFGSPAAHRRRLAARYDL
jgi:alkylation response protein AidB-like acyl-CoA dehydrogenase